MMTIIESGQMGKHREAAKNGSKKQISFFWNPKKYKKQKL
jgi:hypothetical protein